ncbi:TrmB family transcriptional regulator [Natronobiforma cellulositropha]|uniref:TrmB family transcriptional regulator n=1 Tax=Natronobiforma cellulositropha TaxID=1679076 RepID=UPI0021D5BCCB|nr:helix-turn-helix domain-containing protein [Natronobiforma cellulositropha]
MATLRDLGLSEYEARAYRALLTVGPTTAKELSRASDVPMGRIYDVLNTIEGYNLVRSQTASRPKKYVAVEPETALERLLEDKKRELAARAEQYESIVDDLAAELETAEPVDEQFWTAAVGPEETIDLLLERLDAADREIVMVAADPLLQVDIRVVGEEVLAHLGAALERGVAVEILMTRDLVDELSPNVGHEYRETLQARDDFAVRTSDDVSGTFNIIDGVEVCIQVPNPLASGEAFGMIDLKDLEFAADVHREFAPRWEAAEPLEF